jgi:hypothetical protein
MITAVSVIVQSGFRTLYHQNNYSLKWKKWRASGALTECLHPSNIMRHDKAHFWPSRLRLMWMLAGLNGRDILGFERNVTRE